MKIKDLWVNNKWFRENETAVSLLVAALITINGAGVSQPKNIEAEVEINSIPTKILEQKIDVKTVIENNDGLVIPVDELIRRQTVDVSRSGDYIDRERAMELAMEPVEFSQVLGQGAFKSYMDYQAISRSSIQGKYIADNMIVQADGLLVDTEGYIGVAMGGCFGPIGSKYQVTLSSGNTLKVVKVEVKSNKDTINDAVDKNNGSVIEFVVGTDYMKKSSDLYHDAYVVGSFNVIPKFSGTVTKVKTISKGKMVSINNQFNDLALEKNGIDQAISQVAARYEKEEAKEVLQKLRNSLLENKNIDNEKTLKLTIV